MPDDSDNFFGKPIAESCGCGQRINLTDSADHTCNPECPRPDCRGTINRQLRVIEED